MSGQLRCTLVQTELHWEDVAANLQLLTNRINSISEQTDLIILPEMFTTGFSMTPQDLAEDMSGQTAEWIRATAKSKNASVMGSVIIVENGQYFNRMICSHPDGHIITYDKKHLFTLAGEDDQYSPGDEQVIFEINGWKIKPLICYDLRFPVWARSKKKKTDLYEYDLLVYVANWPAPRINAWDTLLKARAIENQSYSIGVNRIGTDGNGLEYTGHSAAIDFGGNPLLELESNDSVETITLEKASLSDFRNRFPFQADSDKFQLLG